MRVGFVCPLLLALGCACAPQNASSSTAPDPESAQTPEAAPAEPDNRIAQTQAIIALPPGYTCAEPSPQDPPPEPPPQLPLKDGIAVVDAKTCEAAAASMPRPMGHRGVEVIGTRDGACQVEITEEMEGGYTVYECRLGNKRKVRIPPGYEEGSNCTVLRSGNVFFDDKPLEPPPGTSVSGDGFVTRVHELEAGTDAAVETGGRASLELRFFEDQAFTKPVGDAPQTHEIVVRDGTAPTVSRALLEHTADSYRAKVGSVRRIVVREEVAPELEDFGPFTEQALLCVEVRVTGFEPGP